MKTLDVDHVRSQFPALQVDDWALLDNAGGSLMAAPVIDRMHAYMRRCQVQLGATYPRSVEAAEAVAAGHAAAEALLGAGPGEVVLGSSSTVNAQVLARALAPSLEAGDEVIVSNLDHETNVGPWRALEASGAVIREWRFDPASGMLRLEDLEPLLGERTRLVCFTHASNLVGALHDVAAITRRVHECGARVVVDGVAYAPHRRVDVRALDVDFYLASLYKTYGPHVGALYGKRAHLDEAKGQYHFFIAEDDVPYKLEPGNVAYELAASLPGILDYFADLDRHHGGGGEEGALERAFELIAEHEERLAGPLLDYLAGRPDVRVLGPTSADRAVRAPTISFTVDGRRSSDVPPLLERHRVAVRWGHFYAYRAIRDLDLLERDGVVRVSLVHYNTSEEVERLIAALDAEL